MKKILLSPLGIILFGGVALAAPDFKGYKDFSKENATKIKTLQNACNNSKNPTDRMKKCNDLMQFKVEAECKFGINPDACKALDEIKNMGKKIKK